MYFIVNDLAEILRINVATRPQPDEHPPCLDCFLSTFISHRRNPIQNGQCADSTMVDVRVMKKRAHILYEMLAGCVQVQIHSKVIKCCYFIILQF